MTPTPWPSAPAPQPGIPRPGDSSGRTRAVTRPRWHRLRHSLRTCADASMSSGQTAVTGTTAAAVSVTTSSSSHNQKQQSLSQPLSQPAAISHSRHHILEAQQHTTSQYEQYVSLSIEGSELTTQEYWLVESFEEIPRGLGEGPASQPQSTLLRCKNLP